MRAMSSFCLARRSAYNCYYASINNCMGLSQSRAYCEQQNKKREKQFASSRLMDFPPIFLPSIFYSARNWIFANLIIKPYLDPEFDIKNFIEGSKQAVEVISATMSESNFDQLKELVSENAYEELKEAITQMSLSEREQLNVAKEDIYLCFPYQIGIMFEDDNRRWVEITMCYHTIKGLKELKEAMSSTPMMQQPDHGSKVQICNYRFIREYTKGLTSSSWLVNLVNHFSTKDFRS